MTEVKSEIRSETNKVYETRFTFKIDNFLQKFKPCRLDFDISGLTTCHLEVHPNQQRPSLSSKFTDLVFRIDAPAFKTSKNRLVNIEVTSGCVGTSAWFDTFEYNGPKEVIKKDFFNQIWAKSYMEGADLKVNGVVKVTEYDWSMANDSMLSNDNRYFNMAKDIRSLASSGELSDFKFIVEKRELEVHKAILAARSPVFHKMFSGSFREATATCQEIIDISADTFEEFLYFIYSGDLRNQDFPVEELMTVADRYEVRDLLKLCEMRLLKSINEDNAEAIYTMASQIQCNTELKKVAFQILQSKFKRFTVALPDVFIDAPDIVHRSLEMKKHLEYMLELPTQTSETQTEEITTSLADSIQWASEDDVSENPTDDESA